MPAERAYVPGMPPAHLTAEELLALSIPDKRVELVRGVLIVREPAGYAHGRVAMNLAVQLATHVESAAAGQVFAAETGFTWRGGPTPSARPTSRSCVATGSLTPPPRGSPSWLRISWSKCCRRVTGRARS